MVVLTSISTVVSFRFLLQREMKSSQLTLFKNFYSATRDALYLGDNPAISTHSESLEKSVQGLTYAVFLDHSRAGERMGGIESLQRFKRRTPNCPESSLRSSTGAPYQEDKDFESERWRFYCQEISISNIRGVRSVGTVFVGFNLDIIESKLASTFEEMWTFLAWSVSVVLILGLILAFILSSRLTKPIQHLTDGAKAIGDGKLDTQIPIESSDELGFLAQEFNWMAIKLKELDQLKDDFVSSVSHELRSPLAAISGYVELLRRKPLDEIDEQKRNKALSIIAESTARLTRFINDILDLAKLKSGHLDIRQQPFDFKEVGEDVFTLFNPLLEEKNIQWEMQIGSDVPVITADDDKMRQVITNLISNALKFTPAGGKIGIQAKNQGEFIQVSVDDTGSGVPKDMLETVFERFRQAHGARDNVQGTKGTGLGLAIAKGIIEAHGGRIWMESEVGKGTTVHFTVPNKPAPTMTVPEIKIA